MIFNGNFEDDWLPEEEKESKLVFIGKNLDHEGLKKAFAACKVTPELLEKKQKMLRFQVGDKVKCNTGNGWQAGEVVALMYRDEYMPPGMVAPYQVQIDGGNLIYAPADTDDLVRKA